MAVNAHWYTKAFVNILGGETEAETKKIDILTDTIKVMLCTSSYTPNQDTHETKADVTNEVTGDGYTAGGQTLTGVAITPGTAVVKLDADNPSWANSSLTARYAVFYDDTNDDLLLGYIDFDENKTSENSEFTINLHTDGFLKITLS